MRNAKSSITRLKNNIIDTLPDGEDIYNFKGINKTLISNALQEAYNLLSSMENSSTSFDIICLKRSIADLTENCNTILRIGFEINKSENFNNLLDSIFKIRRTVKETYLLFVEDCILTAAQIGELKDNLCSLSSILEEFTEIKDSLSKNKNTIGEISENIQVFYSRFKDTDPLIDKVQTRLDNLIEETQAAHDKSIESEGIIYETRTSILKNKTIYNATKKRLDSQIELLSTSIDKSINLFNELRESKDTAQKQQEHIQEIIDDAHRASMAGSFRTRKEELDKPIFWSGLIMNMSLIAIGIISFFLLFSSGFTKDVFDWQGFTIKLPVIAPLIWIAWANNKKHNYLMRIREDYAFKYASAMAFEGYKKQVQDTDPDLEKRLLHLSIENMGQNPIRLFDKKIHATPLNEMLTNVTDTIQIIKSKKLPEASSD